MLIWTHLSTRTMNSKKTAATLVINGWAIFTHPMFLQQLEALTKKVAHQKRKEPKGYKNKNAAQRLNAIFKLILVTIPEDPTRASFRQDSALGKAYTHWFRAKFFQQYRLFFRYHAASKVLVYAWVNDDDSKRAYESADDAYRVFRKMLGTGHPPDDWDELLVEATNAQEKWNAVREMIE